MSTSPCGAVKLLGNALVAMRAERDQLKREVQRLRVDNAALRANHCDCTTASTEGSGHAHGMA